MDKTKKIIISLSISLVVLLVLNYFMISSSNSKYIEVPVFKQSMLKGRKIEVKDITTIQIKKTKENELLLQAAMTSGTNVIGQVLNVDVEQGELVTNVKVVDENELLEQDVNYRYISIPINNLSYPTCINLKKGDTVAVYYTAKIKDVSNAIKEKQRLYSTNETAGLVTCLLFEMVEVISIHDSTGKETKDSIVTDILVRLNKEDAILVANLKSQGTFDIVLN